MIALKFHGRVSDGGRLILDDTELFSTHLKRLAGKEIELVIKRPKKDKTQEQLGYFFAVIVPAISDVTGYSEEEVYGILKMRFLTRNPDTPKQYVASLSQLSRDEVSGFIDQSIMFATDLGAEVPPPKHVHLED